MIGKGVRLLSPPIPIRVSAQGGGGGGGPWPPIEKAEGAICGVMTHRRKHSYGPCPSNG